MGFGAAFGIEDLEQCHDGLSRRLVFDGAHLVEEAAVEAQLAELARRATRASRGRSLRRRTPRRATPRRRPSRAVMSATRALTAALSRFDRASASASRAPSCPSGAPARGFGSCVSPTATPASVKSASARRIGSRTTRHASFTSTALSSASRRSPGPAPRSGPGAARGTARGASSRRAREVDRDTSRSRPSVANGSITRRSLFERSDGERVTAAAAGLLVRVLELEALLHDVCSHSSVRAAQVEEALRVDDHADVARPLGRVTSSTTVARARRAVVELDDVREAGAPAAAEPDAQRRVRRPALYELTARWPSTACGVTLDGQRLGRLARRLGTSRGGAPASGVAGAAVRFMTRLQRWARWYTATGGAPAARRAACFCR